MPVGTTGAGPESGSGWLRRVEPSRAPNCQLMMDDDEKVVLEKKPRRTEAVLPFTSFMKKQQR